MTERIFTAAIVALSLAACGDDAPVATGVTHLDLRLEDGRSPARVLASGATEQATPVAAEPVAGGAPGLWTPSTPTLVSEAEGGWTLVNNAGARGKRGLILLTTGAIDADLWDAFECEASFSSHATARFAWRSAGRLHTREVAMRMSVDPKPLRFELGADPAWTGAVDQAWLRFSGAGDLTARLRSPAFVAGGLSKRLEPTDDGLSGDTGLVALGFDARRVWPADLDMPLFATARIPRGGVLDLSLAAGPALTGSEQNLRVSLDVRRPGGAWEPVAERELSPPATTDEAGWSPWTVDLAAWAGAQLELRLTTRGDRPLPAGRPASCRVLYATPEILGALPAARRPNLLLITVDTTRADAVGGKGWTPHIDALAARGISFDNSWSAAESTTPSHASIMTGRMVQEHGALGNRFVVSGSNQMLAESLRAAGYHTAAAVSAVHLQAGSGFGQGFDQFQLSQPHSHIDGRHAVEGLGGLIEEWRAAPNRPLFLWLHLFDPHTPYGPPGGFARDFLAERGLERAPLHATPPNMPEFDPGAGGYAWLRGTSNLERVRQDYHLGVAYADSLVGEVLDALEAAGQLEHTAVVVTSDHGEGMGERELWFNHAGLFPEVLHVPLILALPGDTWGAPRGVVVSEPVTAIDLAPTLMALAGLEPLPGMRGHSLQGAVARARNGTPEERRVWFQHSSLRQVGYRDSDVHFIDTREDGIRFMRGKRRLAGGEAWEPQPFWVEIRAGQRYLFHMKEGDPRAVIDLSSERPDEVATRVRELERWSELLGHGDTLRAELSAEDEALLRDLGYAGER